VVEGKQRAKHEHYRWRSLLIVYRERAAPHTERERAAPSEKGAEKVTTRNGKIKVRPSTSELHCYVTIGSLYVEKL
jgi:hypothetical protein